MNNRFTIQGQVYRYPGPGGWYFVEVGKGISDKVRTLSLFEVTKVGWGFIKIRATLGATSWDTTLFPQKNGPYLIAIKESVRKKEQVQEKDTVRIQFVIP